MLPLSSLGAVKILIIGYLMFPLKIDKAVFTLAGVTRLFFFETVSEQCFVLLIHTQWLVLMDCV